MHTTATSQAVGPHAIRLGPRRFRTGRDGMIATAFAAAIGACVVTAIVSSHAAAVLGAVYGSMALLVWIEAFRSSWAVGPDVLAARRWGRWRTLRSADVTTVEVDPGEPGVDVSVCGQRSGRVVVPLDEWRRRPGAIDQLHDFLAHAERSGARVEPAVWRAVQRT